jgi:uncharacterized membrane-anchored protein
MTPNQREAFQAVLSELEALASDVEAHDAEMVRLRAESPDARYRLGLLVDELKEMVGTKPPGA